MPKVHTVQKARKDYPNHGIKKGDTYYWWEFRYGGKRMSKTYPRPSQLTQSKMSAAYAAQEALEDALDDATCAEDVASAIQDATQAIRDVAQEYEDSIDNMPEGLQDTARDGEVGEKIEGLNDWADALEQDETEVEAVDIEEFWCEENHPKESKPAEVTWESLTEEEQQEFRQALRDAVSNIECPL